LWEFVTKTEITFNYPNQWVLSLSREGGVFLMQFFRRNGNHTKDMKILNRCQLFLQVMTLSDVVSANGKYILPEVKLGEPPHGRSSTLQWPLQG